MYLTTYQFYRITLLILISSLLFSCSDTEQARPPHKSTGHLVETTLSEYKSIAVKQTISGTLQALREIKITNQAPGLLIDLPVYPGDKVQQGQIIARFDDALIKANVAKARATLNQAKIDLRRLTDLAPRKLASESEVAQAQTLYDIALSDLNLKQTEYAYTQIKSPMNGIVSTRLAESGDVLPLHSHILSIIDTRSLKAELQISELLLPQIDTGNKVDIQIDALGSQVFSASIVRIYPTIDENSRRGTIEILLNPVPEGARAGQFCRITLYTQIKSRLMIPSISVRHDIQGAYVYLLKDKTAQRVNIITGIQNDEMIEILSGLSPQQTIISSGFFGLKNKMSVTVVSPQTATKAATEAAPNNE